MVELKAGFARASISSGWPIDVQTSHYDYDHLEHVPIMEQYDAPVARHVRTYEGSDGYEHTQEWVEHERRERQIGTDTYRQTRIGTHTTMRLRFDDGTQTNPFLSRSGVGTTTRCHLVRISHPLLRHSASYWLTGDGVQVGGQGRWSDLVTARAMRAARRHVAEDRQALMDGIQEVDVAQGVRLPNGWEVREGIWSLASRRIRTLSGEARLPGPTGRLQDGDLVTYVVDTGHGRHYVEQWMSPRMTSPWRRRMGSPTRFLRVWGRAIALTGGSLAIAGYGIVAQNSAAALAGLGLSALFVYSISSRDRTIYERIGRRSSVLEQGEIHMRSRIWIRARLAHDDRLGRTSR